LALYPSQSLMWHSRPRGCAIANKIVDRRPRGPPSSGFGWMGQRSPGLRYLCICGTGAPACAPLSKVVDRRRPRLRSSPSVCTAPMGL